VTAVHLHLRMQQFISRFQFFLKLGPRFANKMKICQTIIVSKSKGHPCTGTEALYKPYGPQRGVEV
jgi:hypothetical protein